MKNLAVVVILSLFTSESVFGSNIHKNASPRLHGGLPAEPGQFPYTVGIKSKTVVEDPVCSGAIVGPRHILTEGWCADVVEDISIIAGCVEWNGEDCAIYDLESVIYHPDYDGYWHNDLAILQVTTDIEMNELVQSIPVSANRVENNTALHISGWSSWTSSDLTWFDVQAVDDETCQNRWTWADDTFVCTTPGHVVAGGDWGTPLVENGELVAITIMSGTSDIHLRMEYYVDFIDGVVNGVGTK